MSDEPYYYEPCDLCGRHVSVDDADVEEGCGDDGSLKWELLRCYYCWARTCVTKGGDA